MKMKIKQYMQDLDEMKKQIQHIIQILDNNGLWYEMVNENV